MRILHINCNYIGTTLHQLMIEKLEAYGIENEVFVPTYDRNKAVIDVNRNVCVSECFHKWDRLFFDYKQRKIIKAIEEKYDIASFDCIHAYTLFTDGNAARVLSEKYHVPYVVAVRSTDVNAFLKKMIHLRPRGIRTLREAGKVFFLSPVYKKTVLEKYVPEKYRDSVLSRTEVIPNGVDDFWFEHLYAERDFNETENRIKERFLRLIYAGGIDRNKNIIATCKAAEIMKELGWHVEFTVVGKIKDQDVYEEIKDKVRYLPARPKEELIDEYRRADIFVMPSIYETFGLVYAEAMTQGLPVVYSAGQGFDGQFSDGCAGYSVDSGDPNDIAEKVLAVCDQYTSIAGNCLTYSRAFLWDAIAEKYIKCYDEVREGRGENIQ